jgi:hypothetical protein
MKNGISQTIYPMLLLGCAIFFTACFSTPQSSTSGRPTFTIVNNTGYTVSHIYISPVTNVSWGSDNLNNNQNIRSGESISWYLSSSMSEGKGFDIRIVDRDGYTYTKPNFRISANNRFNFTINDADARYTSNSNFTPSFLWSTGANQQNSGIKTVNIATAKSEILRLYKLYNRIHFRWDSDNHYDTRTNYQNYINRQYDEYQKLDNQTQRIYYSWVRFWLNNNDLFAYAYISELPDLSSGKFEWYRSILVNIIKGNEVISMSFSNIDPLGHSFPTSEDNRKVIEDILNSYLN